jgi:Type IV secretion system pilin
MNTIQSNITGIISFINVYLVPLIFAVAFIMFLFGVFNYFIAGGASEEKRDEGKKFVIWGIVAFAIMVSVWGIIGLLVNSLNFNGSTRPCLPTFGNPNCAGGGTPATSGGGGTPATSGGGVTNGSIQI